MKNRASISSLLHRQSSNQSSDLGAVMDLNAERQSLAGPPSPTLAQPPLYPCTHGQKRFWVLDKLDPGNPALNVSMRWRLEGALSTEHIEQAMNLIIARHEVLRTGFVESNGQPWQSVLPKAELHVSNVDLTRLSPSDADATVTQLSAAEARAPFDLSAPPPYLRMTRLQRATDDSLLLVTAHYIVSDGWSMGIIAREMGEICAALRSGRTPNLPELPVSYGDYASWKQEVLDGESLQKLNSYWNKTLKDMEQFDLLPDHPRPPVSTTNGRIASIPLERRLSDRLVALGSEHGCTFFMTTLAVLLTLLHRHSGATDIALGTQVAGREELEAEPLIGLFVNSLVLRHDLSGDPSFANLLIRVRETVGAALEHRTMPLEKIIELLRPELDSSRNALVSINFSVQRSFIGSQDFGDFRLTGEPSLSAGTLFDLNFFLVDRPQGWLVSCDYNTDLFEAATVQRLLEHFVRLLHAAAYDPHLPLSRLPLLNANERHMLAVDWNRTQCEFPHHRTVVDLFEDQAKQQPQAIAVTAGKDSLTYAELDAGANRVANLLQAKGQAPGRRTGVLLQRSTDLIVTLLGILKAGNAYVPLDPGNPSERLNFIVHDAGLSSIVTHSMFLNKLATASKPLLLLDEIDLSKQEQERPENGTCPEELAYIIYTSGSTGRPKGVMIPHRALVNLAWSVLSEPGINADDRFVSISTVAFDISGLEIFATLSAGARLIIASDAEVADGQALLSLLRNSQCSVMFATPVTWELLLTAGWNGDPKLKIMTGGEVVPRPLADRLMATGCEFWHVYGPTETTIFASVLKLEPGGTGPLPLGGPMPNVSFHVLDAHGNQVPPGVPGELCIGGDQVAIGYVSRPGLTASQFIPDPFSQEPGARMYRTGDRVRRPEAGRVEFLGRSDQQVKLRGFRIELGEIEAAILSHPAVAATVVVIGTDAVGERALWAYVAAHSNMASENLDAELCTHLAERLPSYMQPAALMVLDALPYNSNGKVDRRALPRPAACPSGGAEPRDAHERRLAQIWETVLGCGPIGRESNFFEQGGHPLLAARMLARVESEFGQRPSLAALFAAPTLRQFAAQLAAGPTREYDFRQVVSLQSNGSRCPIIALNNTGAYFLLSRRLGADQPFVSLELFDPERGNQSLPENFSDIAAGYIDLIRRNQPKGPYRLLGWCVAGVLAFEVAQQLRAAGEEVDQLVIIDAYVPGYLQRLPRHRRVLAGYSHRWKLIAKYWARVRNGSQDWSSFLAGRVIVQRLMTWIRLIKGIKSLPAPQKPKPSAEAHDKWLLQHMQQAAKSYIPKRYDGRVMLFRSADEPSGRFLDQDMGWGAFAAGGVETVVIQGDHFSIFQDPGCGAMATSIAAGSAAENATGTPEGLLA